MDNKRLNWAGREWECSMEGGRIIHPSQPYYHIAGDMAHVEAGGILRLGLADSPRTVVHDGGTFTPRYAVGTVRTVDTYSYGRFSADIILPKGGGAWPAFWLTGADNWPPEIDILEGYADRNGSYLDVFTNKFPFINVRYACESNVHYRDSGLEHRSTGAVAVKRAVLGKKQPHEQYNNYAVDWRPDSIRFYYNGQLVNEVLTPQCHDMVNNVHNRDKAVPPRMYVVLNYWPQNPASNRITEPDRYMRVKNLQITQY